MAEKVEQIEKLTEKLELCNDSDLARPYDQPFKTWLDPDVRKQSKFFNYISMYNVYCNNIKQQFKILTLNCISIV